MNLISAKHSINVTSTMGNIITVFRDTLRTKFFFQCSNTLLWFLGEFHVCEVCIKPSLVLLRSHKSLLKFADGVFMLIAME